MQFEIHILTYSKKNIRCLNFSSPTNEKKIYFLLLYPNMLGFRLCGTVILPVITDLSFTVSE